MTHKHRDGFIYRMPYGFGPTAGPRQGPDGQKFAWNIPGNHLQIATSFRTEARALEELLPPGFSLVGEPIVTVEWHVLTRLEWLAGRGYSMLQIHFPGQYEGKRDRAVGTFLCVLWESLADPILSGREELGFAKLWCEFEEPRRFRDTVSCSASWLSHEFARMKIEGLVEAEPVVPAYPGLGDIPSDGTLHYKYFPATQDWGTAAVEHACLSPSRGTPKVERLLRGRGSTVFAPTTWEQMPTQFHIISALAALPQLEDCGAWLLETSLNGDLSTQRRLD